MGRQREGGQKKRGAGVAKPWETRKYGKQESRVQQASIVTTALGGGKAEAGLNSYCRALKPSSQTLDRQRDTAACGAFAEV